MQSVFEKALQKVDNLPNDADGHPLDEKDGVVGTWQLDQALKLAVEAVSEAATDTGDWLTYEALQKRLNAKDQKPTPPHEDDPGFDPPHLTYDNPEERLIAKQYRYQQALRQYEEAQRTYSAERAKVEQIRQRFGNGLSSYLSYAQAEVARLAEGSNPSQTAENRLTAFLQKRRSLTIPTAAAEYGTFIVGNHGSGKSEIIKQRVWHFLNQPDPQETIIVIDPHGQMAAEIARMKPNYRSDRLVYLDATLDPSFAPCPEFLQSQARNDNELYQEAEHWRRWSGYHRRSRVETKMHCVKLLGQRLMARDFDRQVAEVQIRIAVLNGDTALGIPVTEPVG